MSKELLQHSRHSWRDFIAAGLAGSLAEVVWIALFCVVTGTGSIGVLRQITATVLPGSADAAWAPAAGIALHFALGVLIAVTFGVVVRDGLLRGAGRSAHFAAAIAVLAMIWAFNFFVLLPALNPSFVTIVPLWASFISKLLFSVAMALPQYAATAPSKRARRLRSLTAA